MRTRKKTRTPTQFAGRYFTGLGQPCDCTILDLTPTGCRLTRGSGRIAPGSPVQIYLGAVGPLRANIRWIEGDQAGATFAVPIDEDIVNTFKISHVPDHTINLAPGEFIEPSAHLPKRFC